MIWTHNFMVATIRTFQLQSGVLFFNWLVTGLKPATSWLQQWAPLNHDMGSCQIEMDVAYCAYLDWFHWTKLDTFFFNICLQFWEKIGITLYESILIRSRRQLEKKKIQEKYKNQNRKILSLQEYIDREMITSNHWTTIAIQPAQRGPP